MLIRIASPRTLAHPLAATRGGWPTERTPPINHHPPSPELQALVNEPLSECDQSLRWRS